MPFGLRDADQTFQSIINKVSRRLDSAFAFIDDIPADRTTESERSRNPGRRFSEFIFTQCFLRRKLWFPWEPNRLSLSYIINVNTEYYISEFFSVALIFVIRQILPVFILNCLTVPRPITNLLRGNPKNDALTAEARKALEPLKFVSVCDVFGSPEIWWKCYFSARNGCLTDISWGGASAGSRKSHITFFVVETPTGANWVQLFWQRVTPNVLGR